MVGNELTKGTMARFWSANARQVRRFGFLFWDGAGSGQDRVRALNGFGRREAVPNLYRSWDRACAWGCGGDYRRVWAGSAGKMEGHGDSEDILKVGWKGVEYTLGLSHLLLHIHSRLTPTCFVPQQGDFDGLPQWALLPEFLLGQPMGTAIGLAGDGWVK